MNDIKGIDCHGEYVYFEEENKPLTDKVGQWNYFIDGSIRICIEYMIDNRLKNKLDCKYLILGRRQFAWLWKEIMLENTTKPVHIKDPEFMGLKIILVDSDILEIAGDFDGRDL